MNAWNKIGCGSKNLARESPKSDLRLKRYGYLKFQRPNCNFGKCLGQILKSFSNSRGLFGKWWTVG
jgi:hypothetical protein